MKDPPALIRPFSASLTPLNIPCKKNKGPCRVSIEGLQHIQVRASSTYTHRCDQVIPQTSVCHFPQASILGTKLHDEANRQYQLSVFGKCSDGIGRIVR
jgi:hypothetical protein